MKYSLISDMIWKTAMLLSIAFLMAIGLIWFSNNRDSITHQRPYFFSMYAAIARYEVAQAWSVLTGAHASASPDPGVAKSVPVLVYHGIGPKPDGENISLSNYVSQMLALKNAGYHTVSMQDFYDFMHGGKQLPAKSVLITFDDGRKDSYYPIDPLMAVLHYRATMFVITRASLTQIASKFYLSRSELTTMQNSGHWDLESHGAYGHFMYPVDSKGALGHFYDSKEWLSGQNRLETDQEFSARVFGDLQLAKQDMLDNFNVNTIAFAFPFNEFGSNPTNYSGAQTTLLSAVDSLYPLSFYQTWPNKGSTQNFPEDPTPQVKRILINSAIDSDKLISILNNSSAKSLPYSSSMTKLSGEWLAAWGEQQSDSQGMTIVGDATGAGAMAFLDGARGWKNYIVRAHLNLGQGTWGKVLVRFQDGKNYASCTYSKTGVVLDNTVAGVTHTLAQSSSPVPAGWDAVVLVKDSQVTCGIGDGQSVTSSQLPASLDYGGIGFATWGQTGSSLTISSVGATAL